MSTKVAADDAWVIVLDGKLEDSRGQKDPLPLQTFQLNQQVLAHTHVYIYIKTHIHTLQVKARFLRFQVLEAWGEGGGLQFFDIVRNLGI